MPSKLKKAIGAVKDQTSIGLAKVSSYTATSSVEVAVLKATTHDDSIPVDYRYINQILTLVSSNKMNASVCARAIGKRITRTRSWAVAVKSLILVLRIFQDGDPYFPREILHAMKRGSKILNLSSFKDDSSSSSPWDYSGFVQTFAEYLGERLDCFLTGKLQRRRTTNPRKINNNETIRDMKPGMLLDKISCWQNLLERAISTRPTGAAKMNLLVKTSLYAIVQESFDLYKDISDGLALLLDSFFHLQYNTCIIAFEACVKATKQFEKLSVFYDFCKIIGVGRTSEYPSVQTISDELLKTLKEFLKDESSFPLMIKPRFPPQTVVNTSKLGSSSSPDTSLEDLLSATELSYGKDQPSISIDLETYLITNHDQIEKKSIQSNTNSENDDTLSTRSLPISNTAVDLLDDWTNDKEQQTIEPVSGIGWEMVLLEETKPKEGLQLPSFLSKGPQYSEVNWELVLTETCQTVMNPSSNQQNSTKYYNPFLQETQEIDEKSMYQSQSQSHASLPFNEDIFSSPTFKAASPVFWTGDPFASQYNPVGGDQSFGRSVMNSENLQQQQQQQMWLQQQSKIMAKHSP
ncbi:clathrin coat assembly protein AP180-like [Impatiens glandulifera]|uniref:clathrin coat assembly protein AP180-like n=1 Tax=Impatiens glandulifera TaxID=253017 RepID=UPI001FB0CB34|nr:clathrin coat assembly protein AP180-like [Impatiens glandulifera]